MPCRGRIGLIVVVAVGIGGEFPTPVNAQVPSAGLVGHWSFDEGAGSTAADGSGNGRSATLTYGPTWAPPSQCRVGGCLSFDGADDYAKVADAAALRLTGDLTISAWIKPTGLGTKQAVVSKRYEFELGPIAASSPFAMSWTHKEPSGTAVSGPLSTSTASGSWQHVALVRNGATRKISGYADGAVATTSTYATAPGTSSYNVAIGRHASGGQHFKGLIDEVRIYDRALTPDEVRALYAEDGSSPPPPPPPPPPAPAERQDVTVASGFAVPTSMAIAPDGRIFVAEQTGRLRVIRDDKLVTTPFLTVPVTSSNERGLLGVTLDPNFSTNRWIYVYYTTAGSPVVNRVSRFTASASNPDVAEPGSEVPVLDGIPSETGWHNGGAIHFGPDGKLYVAVGEGHHEDNAQSLTKLSGKLLRINADGTIPTDNPFYAVTTGNHRSIWALGLRNPFTFDVEDATGRIFINNVGENAWEEIHEAWAGPNTGSNAGFNFGWPMCEGPKDTGWGNCTDPSLEYPFQAYPQAGGDCAITGGAFYDPLTRNFPAELVGDYFFADYCAGWIKSIDLTTKAVSTFVQPDGTRDPVDLKVAEDGSLYYLARANGGAPSLHRVRYTGTGEPPAVASHPADATVPVGASATFTASASGAPPLSYRWQRDGVDIPGATATSYTIANAQAADDGARFRVVVSNAYGTATSNAATLRVTSNRPPTGAISDPVDGTLYAGGDSIGYAGTGTDPEDGAVSAGAFTWKIDFHHDDHVHPFLPDTPGATGGSFTVPTTGETSANVWYRIHLTVRDSGGLTHSTWRDVKPRKADLTLATDVPGASLLLDGQPVPAPFTFTGVTGIFRSLGAPSPQSVAGTTYEFDSWSDGGAASHTITTPASATTYTARYRAVQGAPSTGVVAHWAFDEGSGSVASDRSGNGRTGTLTYGPTWAPASGCRIGGCLAFDGADDYVKVPDAAGLKLTGDLTVSAWIKPLTLGTKQSVVSKRYEFELGPIGVSAPFGLGWSHKEPSGTAVSGPLTSETQAGQWQHVVLVRDAATREITGYRNGAVALRSSYPRAPDTSTYNVAIGRHASGGQHFKGSIDEVRLYNRALSSSEVGALYGAGG
jgi:glucose/arabinose dehydrogenase